eukprot:10834976-Prorocentrum_lima.AAC.1
MLQANMVYARLETNAITFSALQANMAPHKAGDQRCQLPCGKPILHTQSWRPTLSVTALQANN